MSETSKKCEVCKTECGDGTKVCSVCGFTDESEISGPIILEQRLIWIKTVAKPYRTMWEEKKQMQKQLAAAKEREAAARQSEEAAKQREIALQAQLEAAERATSASVATNFGSVASSVLSPMPGKVMKIKVAVGQMVSANQEVLVLEAMKMETPIYVSVAGIIQAINVKESDAVTEGQALITIIASSSMSTSLPQYLQQPAQQTWPPPSTAPKRKKKLDKESIFTWFGIIAFIAIAIFFAIKKKFNDEAFFNSGNAYYNKKDYDKAIEDFSSAIKIKPDNPVYLYSRGNAYYNKKDYDKAIEDFSSAIKINPKNSAYLSIRGIMYNHKKDYDKAISDFELALQIKPNDTLVKKHLEETRAVQNYLKNKNNSGQTLMINSVGNPILMDFKINLTGMKNTNAPYSAFSQRPLMIYYFGPHCPHCKIGYPDIQQIATEYARKGLTSIAIAVGNVNKKDVLIFMEQQNASIDFFQDSNQEFGKKYGDGYVPRLYLISSDGKIIRHTSTSGDAIKSIKADIEKML